KTEHPFVCFVIAFWILAQPLVDGFYRIAIPGLPFMLPLNRIFLLILIPLALFHAVIGQTRKNIAHKPKFFVWMWLYIGCVLIALLFNKNVLDLKRLIGIQCSSRGDQKT
ncbi:MAG: TRAP-type mannitol/chloroaromatic compound transport system permease small subunit, partial [Porticoccaceae bacterium]